MRKIKKMMMLIVVITVTINFAGVSSAADIDGLSVDEIGNVGIGTSTPVAPLHIRTDADTIPEMIFSGIQFENTPHASNARFFLSWIDFGFMALEVNDNFVMSWTDYGDALLAGNLYEDSDISLKENIGKVDMPLTKIAGLRGIKYDWKDKKRGSKRQMGLIAQEVEKEFPEAVVTKPDGKKAIAYTRLMAPLIESIKELKAENEKLAQRVRALEAK